MTKTEEKSLASTVVHWQASHGRSHLPWQQTRDPYRVWLSEIMLQQTQVTTVLGYYDRFLERFPDVVVLAAASEDEVMALWSGLGYYSRARNLHRCAQQVVQLHGGSFPDSAQVLQTLAGIGRSTAGAIAAFCFSERVAILDANVRRVLTRVLGFDGDLSVAENERALWALATSLLPAALYAGADGPGSDGVPAAQTPLLVVSAAVSLCGFQQVAARALPRQDPQAHPQSRIMVASVAA